ncbi:MAG: MFS transporter [Deltaproteobacteria bacterium]|nr:MFS transporter [Deltaproteobacteria bacterium]
MVIAAEPITPAYRGYVLGLLMVINVFNYLDRQILSILLEPIKRDLKLSDTALGFLTGIAFALFYTFAGIPIARWADKGVRRTIMTLGLTVWSGMTALTGLAQTFTQLALARIGVGIGEAACTPPAHSLLSDYFPPERRGTALSILALGVPFGIMIGYLAGGWVNQYFGWRKAFFVVGLPGLVLALILRLTLREPPRGHAEGLPTSGRSTAAEPLGEVLRFLWKLRSFRHLALGAALYAFCGYGSLAFVPAFMMRVHGMTNTAELGLWLGLISGIFLGIGTFFGGVLSDRLAARTKDMRWYLWLSAGAMLLSLPFTCLLYLWPEGRMALILSIPGSILSPMWLGPTGAMTQGLVKLRMRATAAAVLLFVINLIGLGLGPQTVGLVSDLLTPAYGKEAVRYALLWVVVVGNVWGVIHYFLAARTLREDLAAKER